MARAAGALLTLLASAAIALGSPLCCLLGTGCCGTKAVATQEQKHSCCSHCRKDRPEQPAPRPCEKKACTCRHDIATHAAAADHVPLVAVFDIPAVALPGRSLDGAATTSHRSLPHAPARASHPLLL